MTHRLPGVEVHAGELGVVRFSDVYVETLTLIDVDGAIGRHLDDGLLRDLPDGLVERLEVVGDRRDALHRAAVRDHRVLHVVVPQAALRQVLQQVMVYHLKQKAGDSSLPVNNRCLAGDGLLSETC